MKTLCMLGQWASYTLSCEALPAWLACAGLLALMVESFRWAERVHD